MKKYFSIALAVALLCGSAQAQLVRLGNQTQGVLPRSQGGTGSTSAGVNGQVLICDGVSACAPGDPIVSYNYANLLNAQAATAQATGSAQRLSTFGAFGTLYISFAGITGSGTSCTVQLKNYDSLGNSINQGSPLSVTPANGTTSAAVTPALALQTAAQLSATYSCSAYPSGGTISVDFVPSLSIGTAGTIKVDGSGVTQPISGSVSVSNFPATQPVSGTVAATESGTWTVQPGNTANTTPWLASINQGGNTATVSAGGALKVDNSAVTQTISGTVTANAGTGTFNNQQSNVTIDYDTGAGTQNLTIFGLGLPASGGAVAGGTGTNPLRTDPTGTTTQPVSGTVTVQQSTAANLKVDISGTSANATAIKVDNSAVTQPVSGTVTANIGTSGSLALDASVTGLQVSQASTTSGQKGALVQGAVTTSAPTYTTAQTDPLSLTTSGSLREDTTTIAGTSVLAGNGTSGAGAQRVTIASDNTAFGVKPTDGANTITVKAASTQAASTDTSEVIQLNPNQPQLTTPLNTQGAKTNNNAAPGATNLGTLPAIANAAPPSYTEGNQTAVSMDLKGNIRVYGHPPDVVGCYMVNGRTSTYAGLAAGTPLFSYRWGDATHLGIIQRVRVTVATTVASNANAGQAERELIVARGFTASDTGGTAVTLTGNNQKMRTSQGTSLVTDMRFGTTITAGTRTLDANPIASAVAWLGVNFTGVDIGCGGGAAATAAAWTCAGGMGFVDLLNATNGQTYPLVLAQNEGFIIRVGKDAMPTGFTQQTYVEVDWCEVNSY